MADSTRLTDSPPPQGSESHRDAPETAHTTAPTHSRRTASPAKPTRRLNMWVICLMGVIASGAFAISADSWIKLAELAGFTASATALDLTLRLAWVLPVVVDAYTALTTWLYFGARPGSELRTYAGWSAFVAAALSVIAQGALHGLNASDVNVQEVWPLVVAVGGVPPVLLGSVIHLLATYLAEHKQAPEERRPVYSPKRPEPARPKQATQAADVKRRESTPAVATAIRVADAPAPPRAPQRLAAVPNSDAPEARQATDEEVADAIRAHVIEARHARVEPGQREMVRLVFEATGIKVGQKRCVRIANTIPAEPDSADDSKEEARARTLVGANA